MSLITFLWSWFAKWDLLFTLSGAKWITDVSTLGCICLATSGRLTGSREKRIWRRKGSQIPIFLTEHLTNPVCGWKNNLNLLCVCVNICLVAGKLHGFIHFRWTCDFKDHPVKHSGRRKHASVLCIWDSASTTVQPDLCWNTWAKLLSQQTAGISPYWQPPSTAEDYGWIDHPVSLVPVSQGSNRHKNVFKLTCSKVLSSSFSALRVTRCLDSYFELLFVANHRLPEQGFNLPSLERVFRVTRVTITWGRICLFSRLLHWCCCAWMH